MKLCWADRIGVAWAALVFGVFVLLGAFGGTAATGDLVHDYVVIALPVWIVARLVDFVSGGPARRRGQFRVNVAR